MDEQQNSTEAEDLNYPTRIEHVYEFVIPARQKPERLDSFITNAILNATRTRVQKSIDAGSVVVNQRHERSNYVYR